ncbi:MAG: MBL fold metallo-hydrolase [Methanotrichaceae archaeon]|nr:MBL fold metallo-hydrolase [Methanotrichaceae archaeon]
MIRLVTISENSVMPKGGLLGEHGLSIYIEWDGFKLLFDTGQGRSAAHNASALGLDLCGTPIALSHGHYDHTGGLASLLKMTGPVDVFGHPDIFAAKYRRDGSFIGIPWTREYLESAGAFFALSKDPRELAPGIWLSGEIPRLEACEEPLGELMARSDDGTIARDPFHDDQALILETSNGLLVVLGCAHSGLINTIEHARRITGEDRLYGVIGGTHLAMADEDRLERTFEALQSMRPTLLAPCHCTGPEASCTLRQRFKDQFVFNQAGLTLEI